MIAVILVAIFFGMVGGALFIVGGFGLIWLVAKSRPQLFGQLVQQGLMRVMLAQPSPGASTPRPTPARASRPATRPAASTSKVAK